VLTLPSFYQIELSPLIRIAETIDKTEQDTGKQNDEKEEGEKVEKQVNVDGEERSKQSPLSSMDDIIDASDHHQRLSRPSTSISTSTLIDRSSAATSPAKPYLSPPSIHSFSMPSLFHTSSSSSNPSLQVEIEKRFSTLDFSANNSHLIDLPTSGVGYGGFLSPSLMKSDSPSMGFGIEATTRFSRLETASYSSIASKSSSLISLFILVPTVQRYRRPSHITSKAACSIWLS